MLIRRSLFFQSILVLGLVAFTCNGVYFLRPFIGPNIRWIFVLLLFLYAFYKKKLLTYMNQRLFVIIFLYIFWCFISGFWSDLPTLSFMKGGAFFLVVFTMIAAGGEWVRQTDWRRALDYTILLIPITLFAGLSGKIHGMTYINQSVELFQGATSNPNFFGCLCAFCVPFLLWHLYKNWNLMHKRLGYGAVLAFVVWFLFLSFSRSSILLVLIIFIGFLMSIKLKNKYLGPLICGFLIVIILLFTSTAVTNVIETYFYKNTIHKNALQSREGVWQDSYNAAYEGGVFGLGYGVSAHLKHYAFKDHALQSYGYGREKGNTQLAVVEETGLVGLVLYFLIWIVSFVQFFKFYFKLNGDKKVLTGIILGCLCGFLIQSAAEAWWGSPAAPEAIYFWALFGVMRGVVMTSNPKDVML